MKEKFEEPTNNENLERKKSIESTLLQSHLPDEVAGKLESELSVIESYISDEEQDENFHNTFHIEFRKENGDSVEGDITDSNGNSGGKLTIDVATEKNGEYSGYKILTTIEYKETENGKYEIQSDADQFEDKMREMGFIKQ